VAKIVTTKEMKAIEEAADSSGLSYDQMMLNAGEAIADATLDFVGDVEGKRIVILVGTGNNGGDGLVVGHHLSEAGAQVSIYMTKARTEDDANYKRLKEKELLIAVAEDDERSRVLQNIVKTADIIIDGVLGTGFKLPLKGAAKDLLNKTNNYLQKRQDKPVVIAVDCPSGLDCDTGEVAEEVIPADLTVTLAAAKPGLLQFPGAEFVGHLRVGDIGIPQDQKQLSKIRTELANPEVLAEWLPKRPRNAHKGTFGRVLVIAGSINYPGAAGLSGMGAYRAGAGLVTMAVPSIIQSLIAPILPEATWILLPHEMGVISENAFGVLKEELERYEVVIIGPGFGLDETTKGFLCRLFDADRPGQRSHIGFVTQEIEKHKNGFPIPPCVIDADGLKLLADIEKWWEFLPKETILTPHPGEMAVLTGQSTADIQSDRIGIASKWAKNWGHIVVLKGAFTVVAKPDGNATVIPIANPALARAGTGDVLTGAIAGFRAQGVEAYEAAILGCYVHGKAGEYSAESLGTTAAVLAGDVADAIAWVLSELENWSG
jgi:hydroxyethylthiazole kinase-like uncharacterized protein yjeF